MPNRETYQRLKAANPEAVKAERREQYRRHKDKEAEAYKRWRNTDRGRAIRNALNRAAKERNPEAYARSEELSEAKRLVGLQAGMKRRDVPNSIGEAKLAQLRVLRAIKEAGK